MRSFTCLLAPCLLLFLTITGSAQEEEVTKWTKVLTDPDKSFETKAFAVQTLGRFGAFADPAIPVMTDLLSLPDHHLRCETISAFGEIGASSVPVLRRIVRRELQPPPLPLTAKQKRDPLYAKREVDFAIWYRKLAVTALAKIGPEAHDAVPDLLALIEEIGRCNQQTQDLQIAAISALRSVEATADEVVAPLSKVLSHEYKPHRMESKSAKAALSVSAGYGADARAAVPAIMALLKREHNQRPKDVAVCCEAIVTLHAIGPDAAEALSLLRTLATHDPYGHYKGVLEQAIEAVRATAD